MSCVEKGSDFLGDDHGMIDSRSIVQFWPRRCRVSDWQSERLTYWQVPMATARVWAAGLS